MAMWLKFSCCRSNLDFSFFSGKPYEESASYTFTPPTSHTPEQSRPSTPSPPFTFLEVADRIGAYEYFRRACEMDPFNPDKREALDQATKNVDAVWQHYNAGCLPGNVCILLRLFLNLWFWDANLSGASRFERVFGGAHSDPALLPVLPGPHCASAPNSSILQSTV